MTGERDGTPEEAVDNKGYRPPNLLMARVSRSTVFVYSI